MTSLEPISRSPEVLKRRAATRALASPSLLSNKVQARHLDRMAVVYVRQSSARQVVDNRESTQLQYGLRERAMALGWSAARVVVIDNDLGQSGQSVAGRPGFQRLLAEVGLDHVGIILGIDMSRLARSCRDWHQLPELCAVFEPDEHARNVVHLILDKFGELGSAAAVLRYLVRHQIRVGVREHRGPQRGQLLWRRPNSATIVGMLHHPIYAGAYVHGRRMTNPRKQVPGRRGSGRAWATPEDWEVLIRDQVPAYITWEQFEANQQRLRDHSSRYGRGAPREGGSILAGLVTCGHCGRRMSINYLSRSLARCTCDAARNQWAETQCQALNAGSLEKLVTRQILRALEPASLELSLAAAEQMETERQRLDEHQRQSVERARYEAARAWRQYTAVEPETWSGTWPTS